MRHSHSYFPVGPAHGTHYNCTPKQLERRKRIQFRILGVIELPIFIFCIINGAGINDLIIFMILPAFVLFPLTYYIAVLCCLRKERIENELIEAEKKAKNNP